MSPKKFMIYNPTTKTSFGPVSMDELVRSVFKPGLEVYQFTNKSDKDGMEIYEGMMVEWDKQKGKVEFEECHFVLIIHALGIEYKRYLGSIEPKELTLLGYE